MGWSGIFMPSVFKIQEVSSDNCKLTTINVVKAGEFSRYHKPKLWLICGSDLEMKTKDLGHNPLRSQGIAMSNVAYR